MWIAWDGIYHVFYYYMILTRVWRGQCIRVASTGMCTEFLYHLGQKLGIGCIISAIWEHFQGAALELLHYRPAMDIMMSYFCDTHESMLKFLLSSQIFISYEIYIFCTVPSKKEREHHLALHVNVIFHQEKYSKVKMRSWSANVDWDCTDVCSCSSVKNTNERTVSEHVIFHQLMKWLNHFSEEILHLFPLY